MWKALQPKPSNLRIWQIALLFAIFAVWHLLTTPGLLPPMVSRTTNRRRSSSVNLSK